MKISTFFFFYFSLILVIGLTLSIKPADATYQITDITGEYFSKRVDHEFNNSLIYVFLSGEELNLNIQCNIWGDTISSGYQGLLIEIKDDITEEIIKSWLILYEDTVDHHFTSEIVLTGVYQIKFSALNTDSIDFTWQIENNIPSWAYDISINHLEKIFFGIERFAEYYPSVEKMVVDITTEKWTDVEYLVNCGTLEDSIFISLTGNFTIEQRIVETMYIDEGLNPYFWYKIGFDCPIDVNVSLVRFKLYYDHEQLENTARMFFSTGNMLLDSIPHDSLHSHPNYLWEKLEPIIPEPPIPPYNPFDTVKYVLIALYLTAWSGTIFWVITRTIKEKRIRSNNLLVPSEKYMNYSTNSVSYSPESYYQVDFKNNAHDYKLITDAEIQIMCSVCLQIISDSNDIVRCPSCDIAFHKNHLYDWVKIRGNCPACKVNLRTT
ncbi:MAG: hypothetical protein KGD64_02590 [Candidatus Heimdallarchaeota archaeon]|nr:hypothetical protein [Candidatus Heimdallarchaeota archaeon]